MTVFSCENSLKKEQTLNKFWTGIRIEFLKFLKCLKCVSVTLCHQFSQSAALRINDYKIQISSMFVSCSINYSASTCLKTNISEACKFVFSKL